MGTRPCRRLELESREPRETTRPCAPSARRRRGGASVGGLLEARPCVQLLGQPRRRLASGRLGPDPGEHVRVSRRLARLRVLCAEDEDHDPGARVPSDAHAGVAEVGRELGAGNERARRERKGSDQRDATLEGLDG